MSIVLATATGNIGGALAAHLLDAGFPITVINRDAAKVKALADRGAKVVEGALNDVATLDKAFAGAKAVFWLQVPPSAATPNFEEFALQTARLAAATAVQHHVERFVLISSFGAQAGGGPVAIVGRVETVLFAKLPNVVALRAGSFFENYLHNLGTIVSQGTAYHPGLGSPYPYPHLATIDIAHRAAAWLTTSWQGQHRVGIHGPKDLTPDEAFKILGDAIGVPIKTVKVSVDQLIDGMKGYGVPDFVAKLMHDMYSSFLDGTTWPAEARSPETTTPTTLKHWATTVFKPAYEAAKAKAAAH